MFRLSMVKTRISEQVMVLQNTVLSLNENRNILCCTYILFPLEILLIIIYKK